jgi:hypothetical protein
MLPAQALALGDGATSGWRRVPVEDRVREVIRKFSCAGMRWFPTSATRVSTLGRRTFDGGLAWARWGGLVWLILFVRRL